MKLNEIDAVIMDMDGVLWRGSEPLPGLPAFFDFLHRRGLPFVLATNNSRRAQDDYISKLAGMGVHGIQRQQILTSGTATVSYMCQHYPPGTTVYLIGGPGLRELLLQAGYALVEKDAQVVVVGIDFELTYEKLRRATLLIRAGADFIGTNPDTSFPTPEGLVPGAGSILALLETAAERPPLVIGKPAPAMFEAAQRLLGTRPQRTLMIGDRLQTDILGGREAGLRTALLLTGVTTEEELAASPIRPDAVYSGLPELLTHWQNQA